MTSFFFLFAKITRPLMKRSNDFIYNITTIGGRNMLFGTKIVLFVAIVAMILLVNLAEIYE